MATTLRQIADVANVSIPAVSLVLNGKGQKYSEATRQRIEAIARDLGYRPNAAARAMLNQKTRQIGVLVPNSPGKQRFTHPLAYETILGINEGLAKAGYVTVLARIDDVKADLAEQSRVFKEHTLDGLIVLDSMPTAVEQQIEKLFPKTVWCDSNVWRDVGCVRRDERHAGRLIGNAAVRLGYHDVTWLTYPLVRDDEHFSSRQRLAGLTEALDTTGIEVNRLSESTMSDARWVDQTLEVLRGGGLMVCDSIYQARKLRTLAEGFGLRAGFDYGLMCTDDARHLDRYWHGLTRVRFDRYRLGVAAADMALNLLRHGPAQCESQLFSDPFHPGCTAWGPNPEPVTLNHS